MHKGTVAVHKDTQAFSYPWLIKVSDSQTSFYWSSSGITTVRFMVQLSQQEKYDIYKNASSFQSPSQFHSLLKIWGAKNVECFLIYRTKLKFQNLYP